MNNRPKESDWRAFRAMVPELRERYLERINEELAAVLRDESLTPTEQFWELEERTRREARILRDCLDGHSRSNLSISMMLMVRCGMLTKEDLGAFSEELREQVQRLADF